MEKKIDGMVECRSQGGGNSGSLLRAGWLREAQTAQPRQ